MGSGGRTSDTAIAPNSLVLVTGANGYIASHVADQFLAAGYKVRGTVRDNAKAQWITEFFEKRYGRDAFEAVVVEDMALYGAFDEAIKGKSIPPRPHSKMALFRQRRGLSPNDLP